MFESKTNNYAVTVTKRFFISTLALSVLVAFSVGRYARIFLVANSVTASEKPPVKEIMPIPQLIEGKTVPPIVYSAKTFHSAMGTSSSNAFLDIDIQSPTKAQKQVKGPFKSNDKCVSSDGDSQLQCSVFNDSKTSSIPAQDDDDDDEEHLPAGQHLLVDIKNVDGDFLDSEYRLAKAMIDVVNDSKLTLLSYHCHKLVEKGVSCVGVLLESHISFHTWPDDGVITLDLFTCGSGELIPILPILTRLFAIPASGHDAPDIMWVHKLRGASIGKGILGDDLGRFVLETSDMDFKREIATTITDFQRIDIYDTINAHSRDIVSYRTSIESGDSYEAKHPEFFTPETEVYLDGILQSTRYGNEAYHEALVQPSMFIHPNPKRVAIVGGGEGSTLREVLKHKSLENVTMIEIDEKMVQFSKEHIPDWNDCSDISGSTKWCGDDPRAIMHYEDGLAWFHDRFSDKAKEIDQDPFDIVILDALDPQDDVPFADILYTNTDFFKTLYNSLSENGILVMQLGISAQMLDPMESMSINEKRYFVLNSLEKIGFQSLHVYEEGNCGFRWPWIFAAALKNTKYDDMWYRNAAEIDLDIAKRMIPSLSGKPQLKFFDGSIMSSLYQTPNKATETVYCKESPTPESCTGFIDINQSKAKYDPYRMRRHYKSADNAVATLCHSLDKDIQISAELKYTCSSM